jgi:predicted lipoprotein with Yx(FWY)xxD motif
MKMVYQTMRGTIVFILAVVGFNSCSKKTTYGTGTPAPTSSVLVKIQPDVNLGKFMVDKDGRTLYYFADDVAGKNTCTGSCEVAWPEFFADNLSQDQLGDGLDLSNFATITTTSGKKQTTYKGWPLYYFAPNGAPEAPGNKAGDGVSGIWFVAKPDYTIMLAEGQLIGGDNVHYKSNYTAGDGTSIYFTDAFGNTIYDFSKDSSSHNTFTKSDFSNNTTFSLFDTAEIVLPSALDKTLFASIDLFGRKQLTYKGWPLYQFGADGGVRGSTKGVTFGAPGKWPVAVKDVTPAPTR